MRKPNKLEMFAISMGTVMSATSLAVILALSYMQPIPENSEDIAVSDMTEDERKTIIESAEYQEFIASYEESVTEQERKRNLPTLDLCNNHFRSWSSPIYLCSTFETHSGIRVRVEDNHASSYLIETIDALQSGERESAFEEPLPTEDSDSMLLYNDLG